MIPADHPVPCLVEDERNAILTSATENLQRAAMHLADRFEAFEAMIDDGGSEDEIALKFGVSVELVRRRLKLARVAPEIIEQFGAGDLTPECVMAFTLTDDHDRRLAVWSAVKDGYHMHPQSIKRQLIETAYSANSASGHFVGIQISRQIWLIGPRVPAASISRGASRASIGRLKPPRGSKVSASPSCKLKVGARPDPGPTMRRGHRAI